MHMQHSVDRPSSQPINRVHLLYSCGRWLLAADCWPFAAGRLPLRLPLAASRRLLAACRWPLVSCRLPLTAGHLPLAAGLPSQVYALEFSDRRFNTFNSSPIAMSKLFRSIDTDQSDSIGWEEFFEVCKSNVTLVTLHMGTEELKLNSG